MEGILEKIVGYKRIELEKAKEILPFSELEKQVEAAPDIPSFEAALQNEDFRSIRCIAEVKKASPSKGVICEDFQPLETAVAYEKNGAAAVSVLTEKKFFQGNPSFLKKISAKITIPCLRKDFLFDDYQVLEARAWGASSFLLIVDCLTRSELKRLLALGRSLKMEALVEVHRKKEVETALEAGAHIVGINNRNLRTFETKLQTTLDLRPMIPAGCIVISESGISKRSQIQELLSAEVHAMLVGESLMRYSPEHLKNLMFS